MNRQFKLRQVVLIGFLVICISLTGALTSCDSQQTNTDLANGVKLERLWTNYFDTVSTITLYAPSKPIGESWFKQIDQWLGEYHEAFNTFQDATRSVNLKSINDQAGKGPIQVDESIFDLLRTAKTYGEQTHGTMNPMIGALTQLWHEATKQAKDLPSLETLNAVKLPTATELNAAKAHIALDALRLDESHLTVEIRDPNARIDVGAIAKGYVAERLTERLKKLGVTSCLISLGGNVRTIGEKPDGTPWLIGIQNPAAALAENDHLYSNTPPTSGDSSLPKRLKTLAVKDLSVVTSGIYQRYIQIDGKRYHHIINPKTGYPSESVDAVTVIAKDSALADAYATALFNMSIPEGKAFLATQKDVEALWVKGDVLEETPGFEAYVTGG